MVKPKTKGYLEPTFIKELEEDEEILDPYLGEPKPNLGKKQEKIDVENSLATIEVLQDPQAMKNIKESLQESGGTTLEDFEKELNQK